MKSLFLFFCLLPIFPAVSLCAQPASRSLFISTVDDHPVLSSREGILKLIDFAKRARIRMLFVQIYQAGRAWFSSRTVDDSYYLSSKTIVQEDPLAFLIQQAHRGGIQVHAWLNLLSLGSNANASFLKKYGTDILTRNLNKKNRLEDYKIDGQYFLEPGDPRVKTDLTKMLKEILQSYPNLDGVQFDYIRYPDPEPHYGYTEANTQRFKKATGLTTIDENSDIWKNWKRDQVTGLLRSLINTTRTIRPLIQVSTTGCMPYARAYYEAYQDWPGWLSGGMVDFVTVMDYSIELKQFKRWIMAVKEKTKDLSKVNISVGAYKTVEHPEIFEQEYTECEVMGSACAVFHYGSILKSPAMGSFLEGHGKLRP